MEFCRSILSLQLTKLQMKLNLLSDLGHILNYKTPCACFDGTQITYHFGLYEGLIRRQLSVKGVMGMWTIDSP